MEGVNKDCCMIDYKKIAESKKSNCKQKLVSSCNCKNNKKELPLITSVFMIVTQRCNLKCKYCFVHQKPRDIDLKTALDCVDFLSKNGEKLNDTPMLNFFGGEPTLKWNDVIVPVIEYVRRRWGKNYSLSMTSNGILLDREKLEYMKKHDIGLLFSIDGDRKTQDLNRPLSNGGSSFDILQEKIPLILEYYPNMTFRSTTDHDNVKDFLHNHKFAVENGYKNVFNIVNVFTKWDEEKKIELKDQIRKLADYWLELFLSGEDILFNPFCEAFGQIKKIEAAEKNNQFRDQAKDHIAFGRCGLGGNRFASVGTDGILYSCQELVGNSEHGQEFVIGNIYDGTDDSLRHNIIKRFDPRNVRREDGKTCLDCKLNKICNGACTVNNYFATGNLNIMPDILCFYYTTLLEEAIRIKGAMENEGNERFMKWYKKR